MSAKLKELLYNNCHLTFIKDYVQLCEGFVRCAQTWNHKMDLIVAMIGFLDFYNKLVLDTEHPTASSSYALKRHILLLEDSLAELRLAGCFLREKASHAISVTLRILFKDVVVLDKVLE